MIPIPYKYRLPFGSSYHYYGTLKNSFDRLKELQNNNNQKIFIVDNCLLNSIGCEPSSYKVIENTYREIEKYLQIVDSRNN